MAAPFPHHSRRRPQGRTRHRDRNTERAAHPSRCARIRQNALPANQQPSSKQVWPSRDVQRHRGALHPRGVARRSEPSIDPESLLHDHYLQALSGQVGIAALGQSASFNHSTTRPRELAEGIGQKARAGKPDTSQDQTGDQPGVQARPTGGISSSYGGGQSRPLRATVNDKQFRPDYFDADSGLRDHQPVGVDVAYAGAGKRCHRATHFGDPGFAVEGHRLGRPMYLRPSGLCLREIRQAQIKGVEASRSSASRSRRSSAQLATRDAVRHGRRFGISLLPAEGKKASERQHAVVRPSTSCSAQSWCCGPAPYIRVPQFRRTLASALVANNYDPKLVQELLRHSNIKTTLDVYAQAITPAKLEAQGMFLAQLLKGSWTEKNPATNLIV